MGLLSINNSLVVIIDIQEKLLNAVFNKRNLEDKACVISKAANILNIPVIVTEQYPKGLGKTIDNLKNYLNPNTNFFEKTDFSALNNSNIYDYIKQQNKKQIVILGIETHICVSQTVEALIQEGFDVFVIKDACGSRAESEHMAGLDRMKENHAHCITAEIALFEWLRTSKHPNFKEIQGLIK